jgi:hypothetical protein
MQIFQNANLTKCKSYEMHILQMQVPSHAIKYTISFRFCLLLNYSSIRRMRIRKSPPCKRKAEISQFMHYVKSTAIRRSGLYFADLINKLLSYLLIMRPPGRFCRSVIYRTSQLLMHPSIRILRFPSPGGSCSTALLRSGHCLLLSKRSRTGWIRRDDPEEHTGLLPEFSF